MSQTGGGIEVFLEVHGLIKSSVTSARLRIEEVVADGRSDDLAEQHEAGSYFFGVNQAALQMGLAIVHQRRANCRRRHKAESTPLNALFALPLDASEGLLNQGSINKVSCEAF